MEFLWNFWDGLCKNGSKSSCIASHLHHNNVSCIVDVCLLCWNNCVLVGLGWTHDVFTIAYHMLMHFHAYVPYIIYILIYWLWLVLFCMSLSLPLSLLFTLVASWHLNVNLLHLGTLFIPEHPLLLTLLPHMFDFMMIKPDRTFQRTSLNETFIRNAKSFCRTSLTLTYLLSFTVGVGSHCVTS